MKIPKEEQETIINFNAKEKIATVYTRDPIFMKQMDMLAREYPETFKCKSVSEVDRVYVVPASSVTFRKPRKMTAERLQKVREQIKKLNDRKN